MFQANDKFLIMTNLQIISIICFNLRSDCKLYKIRVIYLLEFVSFTTTALATAWGNRGKFVQGVTLIGIFLVLVEQLLNNFYSVNFTNKNTFRSSPYDHNSSLYPLPQIRHFDYLPSVLLQFPLGYPPGHVCDTSKDFVLFQHFRHLLFVRGRLSLLRLPSFLRFLINNKCSSSSL